MAENYKKTFLSKVIIRIDFSHPVVSISKMLPTELKDNISISFPIAEPKQYIGKNLMITSKDTKEDVSEGTDWFFHSKDKQKTLTLQSTSMNIAYKKYESFDQLKNDFIPLTEKLFSLFDGFQVIRLGLRYINDIKLDEIDVLNWNDYLDEKLLATLSYAENPALICRAFNDLEFNYSDILLKFQFGIFNPDYPAPIRRKNFILDYDAFFQGSQDLNDINKYIVICHDRIQELFEKSIKDKTRKLME